MTQNETNKLQGLSERTARMEERQESMADDIKDIKEILKAQDAKFSRFVEASEKKFITRAETIAITTFVGFVVSLVVIFMNIKEKL
jgi:uncharacterized protein (UPF0335 family)